MLLTALVVITMVGLRLQSETTALNASPAAPNITPMPTLTTSSTPVPSPSPTETASQVISGSALSNAAPLKNASIHFNDTVVTSDMNGNFEVNLASGSYSVFAQTSDGSLYKSTDGDTVTITSVNDILKLNFTKQRL